MAKKRTRKKPNIPQAAIEQARQENGIEETPKSSDSDNTQASASVTESVQSEPSKPSRSRRRGRDLHAAQLNKRKKESGYDAEYVSEQLANPTKIVTEEELKEDYGFVITDLRNMGVLAAVLFVALIGISLVIL